jgi:hypothetical protein
MKARIENLALALVLLSLSACGVDTYVYLEAPIEASSSKSSTTRILIHNTNNSSTSFLGYEVYYKIYCGGSDSSTPPASLDAEVTTLDANWSTAYPDSIISNLKNKGYRTMVGVKDGVTVSLLLPIDAADTGLAIQAELDLLGGTVRLIRPSSQAVISSLSLYRNATSSTSTSSNYLEFSDPTIGDDCDTKSGSTSFWIRAYAVAFGLSDSLAEIRSVPVVLADHVYLESATH